MKITATLHDLTDNFYAELASMAPREIFSYLNKLKNDLPHCVKIKIGNGQFRDAVELNSMTRGPCAYAYKLEPRKGYKLATFEVSKGAA
jgi:hypothetical protein